MKSIPVEKIDSKITGFEDAIKNMTRPDPELHRLYDVLIITLEDIKEKESEEMIPLSAIEANSNCPFCHGKSLPEFAKTKKTIDELIAINYIPIATVEARIKELENKEYWEKKVWSYGERTYRIEELKALTKDKGREK